MPTDCSSQMEPRMILKQDPTVVDIAGVDTQSTDQIEMAPVNEEAEALVIREPETPRFVKKLLAIVEDPGTDSIVSWSLAGDSFVIWDYHEFSKRILPLYFKHSNFASFNTQLNAYCFRKIEFDRWEYWNPGFQKGKKHLLINIKRKPYTKQQHQMGLQAQVEALQKDRDALRSDMVKLREQLDYYMARIAAAEEHLRRAECMQQQLIHDFGPQLLHDNNKKKKKKRKVGEGQSESGQGVENEHDLSSEGIATKLYKIFVEFDDLLAKPSDLEASFDSLLP